MIMVFGTLVYNDDVSRSFFHFGYFHFLGCLGDKRPKNCPRWQKNPVCCTSYLRTIYHKILINGIHVQKDNISRCFFTFFPSFNFQGQQWGKRAKNDLKWQKLCLSHSISCDCLFCCIRHMIVFFVAQV